LAILAERLNRLWRDFRERASREQLHTLEQAAIRLEMLQIAEHGLHTGDMLPDLALPDAAGALHRGEELLARGPLVLSFFRGGWCPYCDLAMRALEEARPRLEALGATIVGVLPEKPENLARTSAEKSLGFRLLSDTGGSYARICGLEFELTPAHRDFYSELGVDIGRNNAGAGWALPLPASYVVDPSGIVRWSFVDPDYRKRAEPTDLIDAVARLAQAADRDGLGRSAISTNALTGGE
jgi:peroxiredoxin